MVEYNAEHTEHMDQALHALSDRTRRDMLMRLSKQEHSVSELAEPYEMSLAAVSKHIKVLERAGLVYRKKNGRKYLFRMNYEPLAPVQELIGQYREFWEMRLDELEQFLNRTKDGG